MARIGSHAVGSHIASRTATPTDKVGEPAGVQLNHPNRQPLASHRLQPPYQRGRTVVIIDGNSLFYSVSQLGIEIDYLKLVKQLTQGGYLLRALFYTGIDATNEKQTGFLHWMRCHGFRVIAKKLHRFPDGSKKANLEVEMAIDMMQLAPHCDTIILVSGNGELAYALDGASRLGVHVEVVSLQSMLSDRLRDICDYYTDLADLQDQIGIRRAMMSLAS
jgi:uncharacterized LabA/DUF88 family protein